MLLNIEVSLGRMYFFIDTQNIDIKRFKLAAMCDIVQLGCSGVHASGVTLSSRNQPISRRRGDYFLAGLETPGAILTDSERQVLQRIW